jgi:hypothetical protein
VKSSPDIPYKAGADALRMAEGRTNVSQWLDTKVLPGSKSGACLHMVAMGLGRRCHFHSGQETTCGIRDKETKDLKRTAASQSARIIPKKQANQNPMGASGGKSGVRQWVLRRER